MKRIYSLIVLGVVVTGLVYSQVNLLDPVAIVDLTRREPITVKQYRTELALVENQARRPLSDVEKRQVLDLMINERLAMQAAARDGVSINDNELNQRLQLLRNSMTQSIGRPPTETEFAQAMRNETGLELPAFREQLRKQLVIEKYIMEKKKELFSNIQDPTEQELVNSYTFAKSQLIRPDTVRFSFIQVPFTDAASKIKAREIADRLVREIGTNPTRFDESLLKGQVPNAEYMAGDGGFLPRNLEAQQMLGTDFIMTAFALKQGEVSKLIEGVRGFQIIKITAIYEQKNLELDDIFQLGTTITVREYIRTSILQERQQAVIQVAMQELVNELRTGTPYQIIDANFNP